MHISKNFSRKPSPCMSFMVCISLGLAWGLPGLIPALGTVVECYSHFEVSLCGEERARGNEKERSELSTRVPSACEIRCRREHVSIWDAGQRSEAHAYRLLRGAPLCRFSALHLGTWKYC